MLQPWGRGGGDRAEVLQNELGGLGLAGARFSRDDYTLTLVRTLQLAVHCLGNREDVRFLGSQLASLSLVFEYVLLREEERNGLGRGNKFQFNYDLDQCSDDGWWGLGPAEVRAIIKKCLSETANRQAGNQSFHLFQSFHVHVCLEGHGASLSRWKRRIVFSKSLKSERAFFCIFANILRLHKTWQTFGLKYLDLSLRFNCWNFIWTLPLEGRLETTKTESLWTSLKTMNFIVVKTTVTLERLSNREYKVGVCSTNSV